MILGLYVPASLAEARNQLNDATYERDVYAGIVDALGCCCTQDGKEE